MNTWYCSIVIELSSFEERLFQIEKSCMNSQCCLVMAISVISFCLSNN